MIKRDKTELFIQKAISVHGNDYIYTNVKYEKAKKSKNFKNFKCYILECWNEEEYFYKIGRTFREITDRFSSKSLMPYNYKILHEIIGTAEDICNLELKLKNLHKDFKYIPKIKFNGMYECFNKIIKNEGYI